MVAVVFAVAPCGARFDDFNVMAVPGQSVHLGPKTLTLYRSPTSMSTQSGRRKCSLLGVPHRCTLGALQKTHAGPSALTLVRGCDEILSLGRQCAEIFVQDRRHVDRLSFEAERVSVLVRWPVNVP